MKRLTTLYAAFFRVGLLTFGGGYSMLPMLRRELTEKHDWATQEELLDWFAVSQCVPGAIAVASSAFAGRKVAGVPGAVAAVLGVISPSFLIILLLAALLSGFADVPAVRSAFAGIRACVCALILGAVVKLWKTAVKDGFALLLFLLALAGAALLELSPVLLVLLGAAAGVVWQSAKHRGGKGGGT